MSPIEQGGLLINLFGMIGTVAAAVFAGYAATVANKTLIEQRETNKRSIQPNIIVKDKEFILIIPNKNNPLLINWDTNEPRIKDWSDNQTFLKLSNLSNGIAKNLEVDIEIKEYMSFLKQLQNKAPFTFLEAKVIDELDKKILNVKTRFQNKDYGFNEPDLNFNLDLKRYYFVAIGDQSDNSLSIMVPPAYMFLMNSFLNFEPVEGEIIFPPYLEVKIKCEDISGEVYYFNYMIQLRSTVIKTYLQFKEKLIESKEIKFSLNINSI